MRLERSLKNSTAVLMGQFLSMGLGLITRTAFMYTLAQEYLGLNGLFTSFLSLLSLSEMGIGTAITYALYKPLAEHDFPKISALMNLFAKSYQIIGCVIFALGLLCYPFLSFFVGELPEFTNVFAVYLLFLLNTALSYFFSYKRALITASQQDWVNTLNQSVFLVIQNVLQIAFLLLTRRYIPYLCIQILCTFFSNVFISRKTDAMYPFLHQYRTARVSRDILLGIRRNVSATLMHQIGSVVVTSTDNMMIAWIDNKLLAIYSNYTLITQTLSTILRQIFTAVTASVGNLVATESLERQHEMYERIWFVNFWLYGFFSITLAVLLDPFITAWAPENYLLSSTTTMLVVLNFYLFGMRQTNFVYINTTGLFWPLRYKSLAEAVVNLLVSLYFLLICKMGIDGILLGTIVSTVTTNLWWEPYMVVKKRFGGSLIRYFQKYATYTLIAFLTYLCSNWLCSWIPGNGWLSFIGKGFLCTLSVNLIFAIILWRTDGAQYLIDALRRLIRRWISSYLKKV